MIHRKQEHFLKGVQSKASKLRAISDDLKYTFKQLTISERCILKRFSLLPFYQVYTSFSCTKEDFANGKYASISIINDKDIRIVELLQKYINRELDGKIKIVFKDQRLTFYVRDTCYTQVMTLIKHI